MERKEVYRLIDGERAYQDKWDIERASKALPTRDKYANVETWLLWMDEYMARAKKAAAENVVKTPVLDIVRKITALGVACMEYVDGTPERKS